MNADIPPFLTYVRSEFLYSLKEGFGYFTPATVFAISCTKGETIKFHVIVDDQLHVSNIQTSALANSKTAIKLQEEECVFALCPEENVIVNQYEFLSNIGSCVIWKRDGSLWQRGNYIFTVEFLNKDQLHLIELDDGNYIFWPSSNITWSEDIPAELPIYGNKE
jgi:hypothetical protein